MAQRVKIILEDDLDGSQADETVTFGLDGVTYEIDLSADERRALRDELAPWVGHARRSGGRRSSGAGRGSAAAGKRTTWPRSANGPARTATRSATAGVFPRTSRPPTTRPTDKPRIPRGGRISRHFPEGARNASSSAFRPGAPAAHLAGLIDDRLPWLTVSAAAPDEPRLPWRWDDLLDAQPAGADPTARWREALTVSTAQQYGAPAPPAMPAAFVLQWALEVPATIGAYAAGAGSVGGRPLADRPQLRPRARPPLPLPHPDPGSARRPLRIPTRGWGRPARHTRRLALPFAEGYTPGVRLGPHQRRAMVDDVWAIAVHRARQRCGRPPPRPSAGRAASSTRCRAPTSAPGAHG